MKIKIVNLWKKKNQFPPNSDFFSLDLLSFDWVDYQLAFVLLNFSFIVEY